MSRFFNTGAQGWINLDFVREARLIRRDDRTGRETWRLSAGETTYTTDQPFDPELLLAEMVPASKGEFIYVPWHGNKTEDYNARPTEVGVYEVPVIAWAVLLHRNDFTSVMPITVDDWGSDMVGGHPMPDGKVNVPYDRIYENVDDYKAAYLADQQEKWDNKQK